MIEVGYFSYIASRYEVSDQRIESRTGEISIIEC